MRTESKDLNAANIYEAMTEGLLTAGFPRIVSVGDLMPQAPATQKDGRSRLCLWGCGGITDAVRGL